MVFDPLPPRHPKLAALLDFWITKAAGRPMPLRSEIDPVDLVPWLANLTLLETIDGGRDFLIRVHATAFAQHIGYELTGKRLSESPTALRHEVLVEEYQAVQAARPLRLAHIVRPEHRISRWEKLILPVSRTGAAVDYMFAAGYPP